MKQINLELNSAWVLTKKTNDKLPINVFIEGLSAKLDVMIKVAKSSLTQCKLLIEDSNMSSEKIIAAVEGVLKNQLDIEKGSDVASYKVDDVEEKELEETNNKPVDNDLQSSKQTPSDEKNEKTSLDERINSLFGASEFKDFLNELRLIAPQVMKHNTAEAFAFQNYIFSINNGCGLTTYLQLFADVLSETGLFKFLEKDFVVEEKLTSPRGYSLDTIISFAKRFERRPGRLICIDMSEWMSNLTTRQTRDLLSLLEAQNTKNIFVFKVPFVEADTLDDISSAFSDILFVRSISFPPMSEEELVAHGKTILEKFNYTANDDAWKLFKKRIIEEKSDGRFYGIHTVNKVIHEMIYRKQLFDAKNNADSNVINSKELDGLVQFPEFESEGFAALDKMIGMEEIRKSVDEIITHIELSKTIKDLSNPCIHMRFLGNPGTGKTTVARLIGKILKERGVLRNGNFFEYSGRDFCGRYVGETAPKTAAMCRDAYGSVLFIDEAYSLYRGDNTREEYGREALDTLIAEMENHRDDFVVIMAGYSDEMEKLMKGNSGLESRMPYEIVFPNYTREQLYQIFMSMVENSVACDKSLAKAVKAYFDSLSDDIISSKKFSNARFVRNLFERTCAKAAVRTRLKSSKKLVLKKEDFNLAVTDHAFDKLMENKKKNRIGFGS